MPTIEISAAQARALANGEDITVKAEPKIEPLHNVMWYSGDASPGRSTSCFVWDGEIIDGKTYLYRWQRLTNAFGEIVNEDVETRTRADYDRGSCWSSAEGQRIVQVGS